MARLADPSLGSSLSPEQLFDAQAARHTVWRARRHYHLSITDPGGIQHPSRPVEPQVAASCPPPSGPPSL